MTEQNNWKTLVQSKLSRRGFLRGLGMAGVASAASTLVPTGVAAVATLVTTTAAHAQDMLPEMPFTPIVPTNADDVILPEGFTYHIIAKRGDTFMTPTGERVFGDHADWTGYFPIDLLEGGNSQTEGILAVNHEYFNPLFVSRYEGGEHTVEQVKLEKAMPGISHIHIRRDGDTWTVVTDSEFNRRYDATDKIELRGPVAGHALVGGATEVFGTAGNCSGGATPYHTNLSCEENYQDYYGEDTANFGKGGYGWHIDAPNGELPEHYGWIVETDPFSGRAVKRTALGRFRHENVATAIGKTGKLVLYMGDDKRDECVYKFITAANYDASNRAANLDILDEGTLYVANFGSGKWVPVVFNDDTKEILSDPEKVGGYAITDQAGVLTYTAQAARALGGTRVDRPEDIEIHPATGDVYIALTNNSNHGNFHGQIIRLMETEADPEALTFLWDVFAVGGPQSGFSSPDNMAFDSKGNLWMVTDTSSSSLNKGIYAFMGNNSVFMFSTDAAGKGIATAYHFASMPVEAEGTGPTWVGTDTLILAVQHPGEESESYDAPSSRWPMGGTDEPRSAVIAIMGPFNNDGPFGNYAFYDASK